MARGGQLYVFRREATYDQMASVQGHRLSIREVGGFIIGSLNGGTRVFIVVGCAFIECDSTTTFLSSILRDGRTIVADMYEIGYTITRCTRCSTLFIRAFFYGVVREGFRNTAVQLVGVAVRDLVRVSWFGGSRYDCCTEPAHFVVSTWTSSAPPVSQQGQSLSDFS